MLINKKIIYKISIFAFVLLTSFSFLILDENSEASFLSARSVRLDNPIAGAITDYTIKFNITTPDTLGSIKMQFCDDTPFIDTPCSAPSGLNLLSSVLVSQTGETGFIIDPLSTSNSIILSRTPVMSNPIAVEYRLSGVSNPSTPNSSTYLRISTYQTSDASGQKVDQGAAVFSTAGKFGTAAYIPLALYFCAGITVDINCANNNGSYASLGELETTKTAFTTTQFAVATNDPTGYVVYTLGTTLTSGNDIIDAVNQPLPSLAGFRQFGLNLRSNNNPSAGQDIEGIGTGFVMSDYDTSNLYMFSPGSAIAQATESTDYNRYTVTYIANVSLDQPVGVYTTTITYLAVAQF